jgi:hypothetical protein
MLCIIPVIPGFAVSFLQLIALVIIPALIVIAIAVFGSGSSKEEEYEKKEVDERYVYGDGYFRDAAGNRYRKSPSGKYKDKHNNTYDRVF